MKAFECQKEELVKNCDHEALIYHVLYRVLEIQESDLNTTEQGEVRQAIKDWEKGR